MIATALFEGRDGVRELRFAPRAAVSLDTACRVANALGDALRDVLGASCDLVVGEPGALDLAAWRVLARDALVFRARGHATDLVLAIGRSDARRLVLAAFGEAGPDASSPCSALELDALARIAARCENAFDGLGADERERLRPVEGGEIEACAGLFDVRVRSPIPLTLAVGIVREPPQRRPQATLRPDALAEAAVEARVVFAEGILDASAFVQMRPGTVVRLDTKVGTSASLNVGGRRLASGIPGVVASRAALSVNDVAIGAPV